LINEVGFGANRALKNMRGISENFGSSCKTANIVDLPIRMISHSVIADDIDSRRTCPARQPSPKTPQG
jgi:hypothetical protein